MNNIILMDEEEKSACSLLEKHIISFPLYESSDRIYAKKHKNGISIAYRTKSEIEPESTQFDIQIIDNICYLLWIDIDPEKRKRGYGKKLYLTIESFCKDFGCKKINLNPSGEGKDIFWKKLGFQEITEISFVKEL